MEFSFGSFRVTRLVQQRRAIVVKHRTIGIALQSFVKQRQSLLWLCLFDPRRVRLDAVGMRVQPQPSSRFRFCLASGAFINRRESLHRGVLFGPDAARPLKQRRRLLEFAARNVNVGKFGQTVVLVRVLGKRRAKGGFALRSVVKRLAAKDLAVGFIEFCLRKVLPPSGFQNEKCLQSLAFVIESLRKTYVGFCRQEMKRIVPPRDIEWTFIAVGSKEGTTGSLR